MFEEEEVTNPGWPQHRNTVRPPPPGPDETPLPPLPALPCNCREDDVEARDEDMLSRVWNRLFTGLFGA